MSKSVEMVARLGGGLKQHETKILRGSRVKISISIIPTMNITYCHCLVVKFSQDYNSYSNSD